jgi:hypothetical protein
MAQRSNDPIGTAVRKSKTRRRVGQGVICSQCGESRAEALVARSRPKLCMQCYAVRRGKKTTETHHFAGKANSKITVEVPANDHRTLSDAQYEWPAGVLSNTGASPLLAAAAFLNGTADFIENLIVNGIRYVADFLRRLDTWLRERAGQFWWRGTEFDGWQPG